MTAAAHNLGCLMRKLFGTGTPRGRQQFTFELLGPRPALKTTLWYLTSLWRTPTRPGVAPEPPASQPPDPRRRLTMANNACSTGW